ncbi:MAG: ABC transporter ATP-binding protein [Rhizobiaceae bacterium]
MLELRNTEAFYGETQALFGASLSIGKAEVVALLGPNGAGKTTTIRSILGLTRARGGTIRFDGVDITAAPTHRISGMGISWVPDDRRVFPTLTVARNLQIGRRRTKFREWKVSEMFGIFSALEHLMPRECENLSGGEMQMVAISRALLASPGLVLFDEPSQGLAPRIVQDVMKTVRLLKAEGISSLVVEQNALAALEISDRVYVMDHGRIVHEGPARELLDNPVRRRQLVGV